MALWRARRRLAALKLSLAQPNFYAVAHSLCVALRAVRRCAPG